MSIEQRAIGTPFAVLYDYTKPVHIPTKDEIRDAKKKAKGKREWQQELARREQKKSAVEQVLRDNKQFSNWTI